MKIKLFNIRYNRTNRLAQKIGRRLDRENPQRKRHKLFVTGFSIWCILLGAVVNTFVKLAWVEELLMLVISLMLLTEEYLRLKGRAPRRKWREMLIMSSCGVVIFLFFPLMMWMDEMEGEQLETVLWIFLTLACLALLLFGYSLWRFIRIKREIAEEKELLWQRYERQKRLEKLNTL